MKHTGKTGQSFIWPITHLGVKFCLVLSKGPRFLQERKATFSIPNKCISSSEESVYQLRGSPLRCRSLYSWCAGSPWGHRHCLRRSPQDRSLGQPWCPEAHPVWVQVWSTSLHTLGLINPCVDTLSTSSITKQALGKTFWLLLYKYGHWNVSVLNHRLKNSSSIFYFYFYFTPIYSFLALQLWAQCVPYIPLQHPWAEEQGVDTNHACWYHSSFTPRNVLLHC